ncbi:MAG: hypothetical protein IPF46_02725 [Saprospiraceae bacterium]|nr:hypothetical protein [Candidatus Vicinibacter affinis]
MNSYISQKILNPALLKVNPDPALDVILVIPAFYEDNLLLALDSLVQANTLGINVEVLPVLNYPENKGAQFQDFHEQQRAQLLLYSEKITGQDSQSIACRYNCFLLNMQVWDWPEKQEWMKQFGDFTILENPKESF